MLVCVSVDKIGFELSLNQPSHEMIGELRECFIDAFGQDTLSRASKVIVVENHFYHVIKDRYGPILISEHIDSLSDLIDSHLLV